MDKAFVIVMKRLAMICLLAVTGGAIAQVKHPGVFKSIYAAHDVPLELDLNSAFWRGAQPVFADVDAHGTPVPAYKTEILSRWTKDYLYLLYVCPYEELYLKPDPNHTAETFGLWNWDVAELFIGSDFQNIRRYKEFEVSPQGEWVDLDIRLDLPDNKDGWKWNSGFQKAARIDRKAKVWYAAMRIPFSAIDPRAPAAGTIFRVNLYRSQGPPQRRVTVAWSPTMSDTFHKPERFGLLELVNHK